MQDLILIFLIFFLSVAPKVLPWFKICADIWVEGMTKGSFCFLAGFWNARKYWSCNLKILSAAAMLTNCHWRQAVVGTINWQFTGIPLYLWELERMLIISKIFPACRAGISSAKSHGAAPGQRLTRPSWSAGDPHCRRWAGERNEQGQGGEDSLFVSTTLENACGCQCRCVFMTLELPLWHHSLRAAYSSFIGRMLAWWETAFS